MLPVPATGEKKGKVGASIPSATPFPTATAKPKEEPKKEPEKTWLTKLAPTVIQPKLGYRYRREVLPSAIYRTEYDVDNRHLPTLITRDDYRQLFLMSAARNDINATRALLNEGVPIDTANANGETALALAQRYGADDTARLLMARGAQ